MSNGGSAMDFEPLILEEFQSEMKRFRTNDRIRESFANQRARRLEEQHRRREAEIVTFDFGGSEVLVSKADFNWLKEGF